VDSLDRQRAEIREHAHDVGLQHLEILLCLGVRRHCGFELFHHRVVVAPRVLERRARHQLFPPGGKRNQPVIYPQRHVLQEQIVGNLELRGQLLHTPALYGARTQR
jgi:hypothetical protein